MAPNGLILRHQPSYKFSGMQDAPVYLSEAARVLKPGGDILVTFSFGGKAFENARGEIIRLLEKNELSLVNLKSSGKEAFILGRKKQ